MKLTEATLAYFHYVSFIIYITCTTIIVFIFTAIVLGLACLFEIPPVMENPLEAIPIRAKNCLLYLFVFHGYKYEYEPLHEV